MDRELLLTPLSQCARHLTLVIAFILCLGGCSQPAPKVDDPPEMTIQDAVDINPYRSSENRARDEWRHPVQVLEFCGIERDQTVVELWPGSGWWTEILAPFLRAEGRYVAATPGANYEGPFRDAIRDADARYQQRLSRSPEAYSAIEFSTFAPPLETELAPQGSADRVLSFRGFHNFIAWDTAEDAAAAIARTLKPGGIACVVDHRASPEAPVDPQAESGYVHRSQIVELMAAVDLALDAESEVNANPLDTKDYPKGVWTLPPVLRLGAQNQEWYQTIGESDRFTLRFRKPGTP